MTQHKGVMLTLTIIYQIMSQLEDQVSGGKKGLRGREGEKLKGRRGGSTDE